MTKLERRNVKLSLFADNMKPYRFHQKVLHLISEFGKVVGYKVNIQKFKAFFYTNYEISETETRKYNSMDYSNKKNKAPRDKLSQGGKRPVLGKLQNAEERN